jgi:hypothetical protein
MSTNEDAILDLTNEVPGLERLLMHMQRDPICKTGHVNNQTGWPIQKLLFKCAKEIWKQWEYLAD